MILDFSFVSFLGINEIVSMNSWNCMFFYYYCGGDFMWHFFNNGISLAQPEGSSLVIAVGINSAPLSFLSGLHIGKVLFSGCSYWEQIH